MNAPAINRHLPEHIRASRGKRGHVEIKSGDLKYQMDKSRFNNAEELAAYAASKIPQPMKGTR